MYSKKNAGSFTCATGESEEAVEMDVLALAAIYTGYLSATQLATVGRVKGHKAHISALTTIFGTDPGGAPWTAEMF